MANQLVKLTPEGLYCPAGNFYIDPWRPVDRAIITHAHSDHARAGSRHYIAHKSSLGILKLRLGMDSHITPVDYGAPMQWGTATVSLHPAGHVLGSAQIRIEAEGRVWVVSGDYKRGFDPTCEPFEVVKCDTFITEATFAAPIYRWQEGSMIAKEILGWWRKCAADGSSALLFCYAFGKAQRILAELDRLAEVPDEPVLLHGAIEPLVEAYRTEGVAMRPTQRLTDQISSAQLVGRLVLAPPSAYRSPWMRRFRKFETGFASGWVRVRGALRQRGHDRGFVLSDHADWPELVDTIKDTQARRVLVTHGRTDLLIRWLASEQIHAEELRTAFGEDGGED